jgi:hypothetical protein
MYHIYIYIYILTFENFFFCAGYSVQGTLFKSETTSKEMIKFAGALSKETVVDIKGKVLKAEVDACEQGDAIYRCTCVYLYRQNRVIYIHMYSRAMPYIDVHVYIFIGKIALYIYMYIHV